MTQAHSSILEEAVRHLRNVFDQSPDGVYVWVDEVEKDCNEKLAAMFGRTIEEWRSCTDFLESFVAPDDRETYARNYHDNVRGLVRPVTFRFHGLRKDGTMFLAETDMIPISIDGHPVAYHFVRAL